jgi:hypothetical protein
MYNTSSLLQHIPCNITCTSLLLGELLQRVTALFASMLYQFPAAAAMSSGSEFKSSSEIVFKIKFQIVFRQVQMTFKSSVQKGQSPGICARFVGMSALCMW